MSRLEDGTIRMRKGQSFDFCRLSPQEGKNRTGRICSQVQRTHNHVSDITAMLLVNSKAKIAVAVRKQHGELAGADCTQLCTLWAAGCDQLSGGGAMNARGGGRLSQALPR
jgi:hypothetical protein